MQDNAQAATTLRANTRRRLLSPEGIILVLLPTALLMIVLPLGLLDNRAIGSDFWMSIFYVRFFGCRVFHILAFVGAAYFLFSAVAYWLQRRQQRLERSGESSPAIQRAAERFRVARNFVGLVALFAYAITANILAMNAVMYQRPTDVASACDLLMRADYKLFGCFVPFELHTRELFNNMARAMMTSYLQLSLVLSVVLVGLFMFRADRFRQYVLSFVMIMTLGLPTWNAIPAVTPSEAYRTIKLQRVVPFDIAYEIAGPVVNLDQNMTKFLNEIELRQSDPENGRYFVTSIPSPHVAWGLIVVWFGVALYPRLAYVLVPWGLLNALGAIYSLEHYAVDAVAGIIAAIVAIYFVHALVALEARHGQESPSGYGLAKFMREDLATLGRALWPRARKKVGQAGA